MRVIVVKDKAAMGKRACELLLEKIQGHPNPVIGLATGSTPIPLYDEMVKANKSGKVDFSTTITFNLDEYVGIKPDHDQSYRYFMNKHLFNRIKINKANTHVPDGMAKDIPAFCCEYERMMDDVGGVHCQILGIGSNGHIGFNEPGSSLASRTRMVSLTENTIKDNARFFASAKDVPTKAISMGIGTVLEADSVILLANGENKIDAVKKSLEGPITCMVPASALQLHGNVTFIVTEDAAAGLTRMVEK